MYVDSRIMSRVQKKKIKINLKKIIKKWNFWTEIDLLIIQYDDNKTFNNNNLIIIGQGLKLTKWKSFNFFI